MAITIDNEKGSFFTNPFFFFRFVEFIISLICISCSSYAETYSLIVLYYNKTSLDAQHMIVISYGSFLIISGVQIFGFIFGSRIPRFTSFAFCVVGGCFFLIAGSIQMVVWNYYNDVYITAKLKVAGATGLIGAIVFFIDAGISLCLHLRQR